METSKLSQQEVRGRARKIRRYLDEKRIEKGFKSFRQVSRLAGVSHGEISAILTGKRKTLNPIVLYKISNALGSDYAELFKIAFSKSKIESFIPEDIVPDESITLLPVVGTIRAGQPIYAEENIIGYEPINPESIKSGKYFFLLIEGDSMKGSGIVSGSFALVRKQAQVENGEIAVVMVDDENATIKRVYYNEKTNTVTLQPDNPEYNPQTYRIEDIHIIGKVVRALIDPNKIK